MKAEIYKDELGKEFDIVDIPADMKDLADEWREKLTRSSSRSGRRADDEVPGRRRNLQAEVKAPFEP